MASLMRNRSFSFYLLLFIIILISLITAGITIGDLILVNADFQDNAALLRNQTEGNLNISVKAIDNGLKLFDNTLNRRMEAAFVLFVAEYNRAGGDPSIMDLEQLKRDLGGEM
jgi:hypothetical protein